MRPPICSVTCMMETDCIPLPWDIRLVPYDERVASTNDGAGCRQSKQICSRLLKAVPKGVSRPAVEEVLLFPFFSVDFWSILTDHSLFTFPSPIDLPHIK